MQVDKSGDTGTEGKRDTRAHRLTDRGIKEHLTRGVDIALHDGAGLHLRIRNGRARWAMRQTVPGSNPQRRTWAALFDTGDYPQRSLKEAREAAAEVRSRTTSTGEDLVRLRERQAREKREAAEREKQQAEQRLTVRQLFDRWASTDLQPRPRGNGKRAGRKDGGDEIRRRFNLHVFPALGDRVASEVTRAALLEVLDRTRDQKRQRTTGTLLQELGQMYRFAVRREMVLRNPLDGVTKADVGGEDVERARVLSDEEIKALSAALPASGLSIRAQAGVLLVLATGARIGELLGATWAETQSKAGELRAAAELAGVKYGIIDVAARRWYLPDTKNQRDHTIHLSDFALRQVARVAEVRQAAMSADEADGGAVDPRPWLFRERRGEGPATASGMGKQVSDRQRAPEVGVYPKRASASRSLSLPGGRWTMHDLRRTAATILARLGHGGDVIDACLNHAEENKVRRIYIVDRRQDQQREAFDALGARLAAILEGTPATDRPSLRRVA